MDLSLTPAQAALRENARRFVVEVLQPVELELEAAGGRLPASRGAELRLNEMSACSPGRTASDRYPPPDGCRQGDR